MAIPDEQFHIKQTILNMCICSWWWDVHTCIYFISSVVFADFLIKWYRYTNNPEDAQQ